MQFAGTSALSRSVPRTLPWRALYPGKHARAISGWVRRTEPPRALRHPRPSFGNNPSRTFLPSVVTNLPHRNRNPRPSLARKLGIFRLRYWRSTGVLVGRALSAQAFTGPCPFLPSPVSYFVQVFPSEPCYARLSPGIKRSRRPVCSRVHGDGLAPRLQPFSGDLRPTIGGARSRY